MGRTTALKNFMVKPQALTEARTLTDSDSGKTYFLNAAGGFTVTLPEARGGVIFNFIVKTAPTSADYIITTKDSDKVLIGKVMTADTNAALDATSEISGASNIRLEAGIAAVDDSVEMVSDGTYWYVSGFCSVNNAINIAEQSKSPSSSPSTSRLASPSVSTSTSPSVSTSTSPSVSASISKSTSPSISPSAS